MKPVKKNNFFTFIFSFLPGAAEMYLGFMKNGFSIMAIFFVTCALGIFTEFDFIMAIVALEWFYGFFHARNVAKLDDEGFAGFPDVYVWEEFDSGRALHIPVEKVRTAFAVILMLIGLGMIWDYVAKIVFKLIPNEYWDFLYPIISDIPSVLIAIVLVAAGFILIAGKKKQLVMPENAADVVAKEVFTAIETKAEPVQDDQKAKEA